MHDGNYFEVGAAVLTFAWNTDLVPDGLTDYPDLLDPALAGGKIGVIDPAIGPAARRLLPVARGELRRGLRRRSWPPRSRGSTRARCRSVRP